MIIYDVEAKKPKVQIILDASDLTSESDIVALLSITTAPSGEFKKGSKYYNSSEKKIYTATQNNTWENAKTSDPKFGIIYQFGNIYYQWDGDNLIETDLEKYEVIANKATNFDVINNTKYPTTKAVSDYVVKQSVIRNFTDAGITKTTSSDTFVELAEEIRGKEFPTGTTLYGEVENQGMPTGIGNAEIRVEILETKSGSTHPLSQVIEFTLFSTDIEPKEWTFIYYNLRDNPWTWVPKAVPTNDYTSTETITVPTSKALSDGLATKQDVLTAGQNITIEDNVISAEINKLYDTKIFTEPAGKTDEERAGWAAICKAARVDLLKVDVPTIYDDLLGKYENVESITELLSKSNSSVPAFYLNGFYYYIVISGSYTIDIYKSSNVDLSDGILVKNIGNAYIPVDQGGFDSRAILFTTNNEHVILVYSSNSSTRNVVVMNTDFEIINTYTFDSSGKFLCMPYFHNNILYCLSPYSDASYPSTSLWKFDYLNSTLDSYAVGSCRLMSNIYYYNNYLYFAVQYEGSALYMCKFDLSTDTISSFGISGWSGTLNSGSIYTYNNSLKFMININMITINNDDTYTMAYLPNINLIHGNSDAFYTTKYIVKQIGNTYYIYSSLAAKILSTTNWSDFTELFSSIPNIILGSSNSNFPAANSYVWGDSGFYFVDSNFVILGQYNSLYYTGQTYIYTQKIKTQYTDEYSTGNINYYKNGNWKICVPDQTNDANLDALYIARGYSPYFRIDTTNETVSLQRDNHLWAMMYVGDDFIDNNLPTGDWERDAKYSEVASKQDSFTTTWYDISTTSSTFTASDFTTISKVYLNGLLLRITKDYTIVSGNVITFTNSLTADDELAIEGIAIQI